MMGRPFSQQDVPLAVEPGPGAALLLGETAPGATPALLLPGLRELALVPSGGDVPVVACPATSNCKKKYYESRGAEKEN